MLVEDFNLVVSYNVVAEGEKINGKPVLCKASKELEVEVEYKRVRDTEDEGNNHQEPC